MSSLPLPITLKTEVQILIVDDSRVQAKVLKDLLQRRGFEVRVASDGREALEEARRQVPTLVISDIIMPVMNGYDMCLAMKEDQTLKNVPVILLTSLSDTDDILLGLLAQADYYLTKPYSEEYLLSTIHGVLRELPFAGQRDPNAPLEVTVNNSRHPITASRQQMLSLLLSTYGNAVEQNRILLQVQRELKTLNEQLREQAEHIVEQQRKLEEANAQLQALATLDGLTQLKNHRAFKEKLEEEMPRAARYGQPLSLLLMDIDYFKQFNDTFGHPAGDEVLRTVAQLLRDNTRATDFVARYGGEEFAVLMPNTDQDWSYHLAERLRLSIEREPWTRRSVTASFGAATFQDTRVDAVSPAQLLQSADRALYHSKRTGRNTVTHAYQTA